MKSKIKAFIYLISISILIFGFAGTACAGNYSYFAGQAYSYYKLWSYTVSNINIVGFNISQGFSQQVAANVSMTWKSGSGGGWYDIYLNYTLPDDGSTWKITGGITLYGAESSYFFYKVDTTQTTPGTFTGISIGQAVNAANSAKISADAANINALGACNAVSDTNGNTITAVRDNSGTVLDAARTANTKLDSLHMIVTSIQSNIGADITPPVVKLRTVSGAMATSGDSIFAVLDVSDNVSTIFTYSLDALTYSPVPFNKIISLPLNSYGNNVISVWVKDEAGNVGTASITVRKL
ncbi:MAG: hypothetical protein ACOY40_04795 [Bacillota bacterium]